MLDTLNTPADPGRGSSGYAIQYGVALVNAFIGIVAAVLTGVGLTLHPSWLTADVAATAGVISAISIAASQLLPPVTRTPGARETKYLAASQGVLPKDLAAKYPLVVVPTEPTPPPVP